MRGITVAAGNSEEWTDESVSRECTASYVSGIQTGMLRASVIVAELAKTAFMNRCPDAEDLRELSIRLKTEANEK